MTLLRSTSTLLVLALPASADVQLPALFSDGMVLQRGAVVPVWGWADPGEQVVVKGGWSSAEDAGVTARADADGSWRVDLQTPEAAGAATLVVSSGARTTTIRDVLLGEVWLCSGQSNMEWHLSAILEAARESGEVEGATLEVERPNVRFFDVPHKIATTPERDCGGRWVPAVGEDAHACSAVAYYFACALQDELDVPVGLVTTTWGGTPAQSWTSAEVVRRFPDHARTLDGILNVDDDPEAQAERVRAFWDDVDERAWFAARFKEPAFDDDHWTVEEQPALFREGHLGAHDGIAWYRRTVDVPERWAGSDLQLQLPPIDDFDRAFWDGEVVGSTLETGAWERPRRYTIPASLVEGGEATIAICCLDTGGGGGFGKKGPMRLVRGEEFIEIGGPWRVRKGMANDRLPRAPLPVRPTAHTPSALYNGMLAPLVPYRVQGAIWYQGESNRSRAREYRALFPAMIVDWRTRWAEPELPFYFAQIAPYDYRGNDHADSLIAQVREAQAMTTRLPRTGMVLTCDIGNPRDIHPKNKWEVGRRFALFALRDVYGRGDVEPDGPTLAGFEVDGAALRVTFDHVGEGLVALGDEIAHFELAGADGTFHAANARVLEDGRTIELTADAVPKPVHARYLWSDAAEASLAGSQGLPAAPFRTNP